MIPDHTLRKAAVEQYLEGGLKLESIVYQVGRNHSMHTHSDAGFLPRQSHVYLPFLLAVGWGRGEAAADTCSPRVVTRSQCLVVRISTDQEGPSRIYVPLSQLARCILAPSQGSTIVE